MLPSETMIWQPEFTDKTLSRKPGAVQTYSHGKKFSVGLGHGWDSIVSVNGVDTGETTMRWYKAGTQNLTIGSRLYGESSKIQPGVLSGSATLLMILP
ncbi:TPA: hypothetical protein IB787_005183 [Escherichia coli]|nr:hypothetical protein [Escherichia coli]